MRKWCNMFIVLIALLLVSNLFAGGETGKISGTIVDANSGRRLAGVYVLIEGTKLGATTNNAGNYTISNVPTGTYNLRISLMGYQTEIVNNVTVKANITTTIDKKLKQSILERDVTDEETPMPSSEGKKEKPASPRTTGKTITSGSLSYGDNGDGDDFADYYQGNEKFGELIYSKFFDTEEDNLSTFAIDVDNGSYTLGRKKLNQGILPASESVRVEEYINYFQQDYKSPRGDPFSVIVDGSPSPFRGDDLHIVRIGIQGKTTSNKERRPWNLTFLIDISGSMQSRMDLVKKSLYMLIDNNMKDKDKISVCTYAGSVGTVLLPTSLEEIGKEGLKGIISDLEAGGSTAMASGLQNAYNINDSALIEGGVNRIVVCSDGDANVGATGHNQILDTIAGYVEKGITLSTLGFGQGNYNDYLMEQLADNGNGNYYYIDTYEEAERFFSDEFVSVMEIIAKDVKIQVEFNPKVVRRYRLIGYENRDIADEDFVKETTDAGELGAGHRVTALYEIELKGNNKKDIGTVHLRYKLPNGKKDILMDVPILRNDIRDNFFTASERFQFTVCIAEFAEILRKSPNVDTSLDDVNKIISDIVLPNEDKRDKEFRQLLKKAMSIAILMDE